MRPDSLKRGPTGELRRDRGSVSKLTATPTAGVYDENPTHSKLVDAVLLVFPNVPRKLQPV